MHTLSTFGPRLVLLLAIFSLTTAAVGAPVSTSGDAVEPALRERIIDRLQKVAPQFRFGDLKRTPVTGIYEVQVIGGPVLYLANEGEFFFDGDLYQVRADGFVNVRERAAMAPRRARLATVPAAEAIVFPAVGDTKAIVHVFTDIDCGYCRKLHQEVPEMNRLGIEVRYLAFPRAGVGSPAYRKYVTAWCDKDRRAALTRLKGGDTLPDNLCPDNPVARQYELGAAVGVNGTPAIVLPDGALVPGYITAAQLAKLLDITPS